MTQDENIRRKLIKRFHDPGDLHELTFSCYKRLALLTNNAYREKLSRCIDEAGDAEQIRLVAFVYMPEHVHLLVWPQSNELKIDGFLHRVKRPVSLFVRDSLHSTNSRLLARLVIRERPGKIAFRFWQEGPGFDRNLNVPHAVSKAMDYIHLNPVRRGLCQQARNWRWSSARFYESDSKLIDESLPRLTPLPAEFWRGAISGP